MRPFEYFAPSSANTSSLQTTQRYTEVLDDDRIEALSVLPERKIPTRSGRRAA